MLPQRVMLRPPLRRTLGSEQRKPRARAPAQAARGPGVAMHNRSLASAASAAEARGCVAITTHELTSSTAGVAQAWRLHAGAPRRRALRSRPKHSILASWLVQKPTLSQTGQMVAAFKGGCASGPHSSTRTAGRLRSGSVRGPPPWST